MQHLECSLNPLTSTVAIWVYSYKASGARQDVRRLSRHL